VHVEIETLVGLATAVALFVYLTIALLHPEKF
jgi:K+-transporting ATPase KdpF subunit